MPPKKNAKAAIITEGTLDEMRDDLGRLTSLLEVNYLNRILGLVSGGQHLRGQTADLLALRTLSPPGDEGSARSRSAISATGGSG
jgi:hypothetical protein